MKLKGCLLRLLCSKKRLAWDANKIKKILLLRHDRLGDMIVSTPLITELKSMKEGIEFDVLASHVNAIVPRNMTEIRKVYVYPRSLFLKGKLLIHLRYEKYDLVIDLNHSLVWETILQLKIIASKWVLAPNKGTRYGQTSETLLLYDKMSSNSVIRPMSLVYVDLIRLIFPDYRLPEKTTYFLPRATNNCLYVDSLNLPEERVLIGVNFTGGRHSMTVDATRQRDVLTHLIEAYPDCEIVHLGDNTKYKSGFPSYFSCAKNYIYVERTSDFLDVCALINRLDVLISPDTSLVHVASAFNKPIVAIYANSPELYAQWQPMTDAPCRVIFSKHPKNIDDFSTQDLFEAIKEVIATLVSLK